jgi:hypothetical protein
MDPVAPPDLNRNAYKPQWLEAFQAIVLMLFNLFLLFADLVSDNTDFDLPGASANHSRVLSVHAGW